VWCSTRQHWTIDEQWKNYAFTDEMSIEVGGIFGRSLVCREQTERWVPDCLGAKKIQGPTVMCWGMIGYGWKGICHVSDPETPEERASAEFEIEKYNTEIMAKCEHLHSELRASTEWPLLRTHELKYARIQREEERNGARHRKITQSWRGKRFKIEMLTRIDDKGVDAWRYVKHVAEPLLWPECCRQLQHNPNFILMEDGASCHTGNYTSYQREKHGIPKTDWPPSFPEFNPIECIWTILKRRIQRHQASESVTTIAEMKVVFQDEWDKITVHEINTEIVKLPKIMQRCLSVNGSNNYHA